MDFEFDSDLIAEEGPQTVRVEGISEETSSNSNPMFLFKLRSKNGGLLRHYCLNVPNKRWMLKKTIEAITGQKQPSGPVHIDERDLVGRELKVLVEHETYRGKTQAKIVDVISEDVVSPGQTNLDEFSGEVLGEGAPF